MNQYKIVDMSNNKYIITGISLGKNINSYFCINKNNSSLSKIIIIDTDVISVLDGQIVFSIKNISSDWLNNTIYSFCHLLTGNNYDLKNMEFDIKITNQEQKKQIEEFIIKLGFKIKKEESTNNKVEPIENNTLIETNKDNNEIIPKNIPENISEIKEKETYVEMVSEFEMDIINDNDYEEETTENSGKIFLPMTLFVISIFLFIASGILAVMT